jgi:hypothetical protein
MAVDPAFIDASGGAPAYSGADLRLGVLLPMFAGAGASLGVRTGVRLSGSGTDLLVQAQASPDMTVKVNPGSIVVQGAISATQGPYTWTLDAVTNVTIAAAHATLARTDLVVVRIRDANVDTSGQRDGAVAVVTGTAGGGVPSLPTDATYVTLAQVAVAGADTAINTGDITDKRQYTTGLGGVLTCSSTTEPAATSVAVGQVAYRSDLGQLRISDGAAWQHISYAPPFYAAYKPSDDSSTTSTTLKNDAHLLFPGLPINTRWILTSNVWYYADSTADIKVGWSGPAGATLLWNLGGLYNLATGASDVDYHGAQSISGTDVAGGAGAPTPPLIMRPSGLLTVGGTSGTLQFRWAANVTTANGVDTLAGSWMMLTRIG